MSMTENKVRMSIVKEEDEEKKEDREQYDNLFQYLLACIGFAVGLGNVWRFPRVALENGGGAFIIPWIIVLCIQGIPLMLVELTVGQRYRGGPAHSYGRMNKWCWGVGFSMFFCSLYTALFYNSILSVGFVYFFNSFTKNLPWLDCPEDAGSECTVNPEEYYFDHSVLPTDKNLEVGGGEINWPLYFATTIAWIVVYLSMFVGVKSMGKVIYFTALYPYLMLTILFIVGLSSKGAGHGLDFLFKPDWGKLGDFRVWQAASEQVFFSASLSFGGLIAMASYMPVKNNSFRDTFVICIVNSCTSLYAAIGIFSIKGNMGLRQRNECDDIQADSGDITAESSGCGEIVDGTYEAKTIEDFVSDDSHSMSLVFISMARAVDLIGDGYAPSVLAIMFYLMIITLGLDSAFGAVEGYLSILKDFGLTQKFGYRWVLTACIAFSIVFALLFCSSHGMYFIDVFDKYGCVLVLVFIGLFQLIAVGWVNGFKNFARDFKLLNDFQMPFPMMFLVKYVAPITIALTLIGQFVVEAENDSFMTYGTTDDKSKTYPGWMIFIAVILFISAVMWFPVGALITFLFNNKGKEVDWGTLDFDYDAMKKDIPAEKYNFIVSTVFMLDEYDYPENV